MRRNRGIEPFRNKLTWDPDFAAAKCKALTDAIHKLYAGDVTSLIFENLYRDAYDCMLYKRGEELYSAVESALASEVQDLGRALDASQDDVLFLRELLDKWNQHTKAVSYTRDILMLMDRTYITTNKKTPIYELGARLWRDTVIRSDKVWTRLMEAVRRRSGGEDDAAAVPGELMACTSRMLEELGLGGEVYHEVNPPRAVSSLLMST